MDILLHGPVLGKMLLRLEPSATALVEFGLLPIAKLLVLSGFGLAMANPYINILPAPSRRLLSKVIMISCMQLSWSLTAPHDQYFSLLQILGISSKAWILSVVRVSLASLMITADARLCGTCIDVLQLVFSVFLPCLIFTQLGKAITLQKILQWWEFSTKELLILRHNVVVILDLYKKLWRRN